MRIAGRVSLLSLILVSAIANASDNEAESKRIQGRYERIFTHSGAKLRSVLELAEDKSTVTTYDEAGTVVDAHTSTFKTEKRGPVRVFTFNNSVVTAGPNKGYSDSATRSYIYRLDDKTFTEVWGLLEGDESPPRMAVWRKLDEK